MKLHDDLHYFPFDHHMMTAETTLEISYIIMLQCCETEVGCVESIETSYCGRFWGPLVMVDVEPLSALNHGQTVNKVTYHLR